MSQWQAQINNENAVQLMKAHVPEEVGTTDA